MPIGLARKATWGMEFTQQHFEASVHKAERDIESVLGQIIQNDRQASTMAQKNFHGY